MELVINHVKKIYGKQYALNGIDCTFKEGIYGILGPNGAGKTTLISIVTGIMRASYGNVSFEGKDIQELDVKYLDRIGYSPQYPVFYKNFLVEEFLGYMCALKKIPKKFVNVRIDEVLKLVNLENARKKQVGALSGGMRQRLSIAQAVLNNPSIIVLDEPTAGLDPGERIRFRNIISNLAEGKIVLITTHIVSDIEYIANEVLIMKDGNLVKKDRIENLTEEMQGNVWGVETTEKMVSKLTKNYLVSNIKQDGKVTKLRVISCEKPCEEAITVTPNLEDVFLKVFGNIKEE